MSKSKDNNSWRAIEMVANLKRGIEPSDAIHAIESALTSIAANKFKGAALRVTFNRSLDTYEIFRRWTIIDSNTPLTSLSEDAISNSMPLEQARKYNAALNPGDEFEEKLEVEFSRHDISKAKKLFDSEIKKSKDEKTNLTYQNHIGEIFRALVIGRDREGVKVELEDGTEAFLPTSHMIPTEDIRLNDQIYAHLYKIDPNTRGPQLFLSRISTELVIGLFKLKILEVEAGIIEIKGIARDPGSRAKVAVKTNDGRLNPIGTCIGRSGERIQSISNELNGEHIDIILWDENPVELAINAIAPAEVVSIVMDEETHTMDIAVNTEHARRAIGRYGQNVRLASELSGWALNIMSTEEAEKKSREEFNKIEALFIEKLGISSDLANLLVQNGFSSLEEIVYMNDEAVKDIPELINVEVEDLRNRAKDCLLAQALGAESNDIHQAEPSDSGLSNLKGMTDSILKALTEQDVTTRDSLAELSIDDLIEIVPLTRNEAGKIIMAARAHWFKNTDTA